MERNELLRNITHRLLTIYGDSCPGGLAEEIVQLCEDNRVHDRHAPKWDETDAVLITYADSISKQGYTPLYALRHFTEKYLRDRITCIHILPFYPSSSDGGFAVMDYTTVSKKLGTWQDISGLTEHFSLMFDFVANHASQHSKWFTDYIMGKDIAKSFFIEADPSQDYSAVGRPCTGPLFAEVHTPAGTKHVWATFSHDQIDLNYRNPEVLRAMLDVLAQYLRHGARFIRLGAAGFLWKENGTPCLHLPQTHELVKLFRDVAEAINPSAVLVTETNVPNAQNLSYLAHGDEAHVVYQYSLPPLLLHALYAGTARYLTQWAAQLEAPAAGCTFLNITATHDGIGLLPLDGLLPENETAQMLVAMQRNGGRISTCQCHGYEKPYELNISYFDALRTGIAGEDGMQVQRFICSQAIALSLRGIPALYIHSLMATPNDYEGFSSSGNQRSLHRRQLHSEDIKHLLKVSWHPTKKVFSRLMELLEIRRLQPAFHPDALQQILQTADSLFAFKRTSAKQQLLVLANVSPVSVIVDLTQLAAGHCYTDITDEAVLPDVVTLQPYCYLWVELGEKSEC